MAKELQLSDEELDKGTDYTQPLWDYSPANLKVHKGEEGVLQTDSESGSASHLEFDIYQGPPCKHAP
ncbi:hypothetical protein BDR03DRAFT_391092 [Suillus americanus]|nr:hypothetical protein BDR03DRAFT_391092 [Suillus americanus]